MAEVKFKFVGDDSELRRKLANLSKIQSEMTEKFSKDLHETLSSTKYNVFRDITKEAASAAIQTDRLNKIAANKGIVNAKLEQIESIRRLREERSKEISNLITLKQIESEARTVLAEKKLITESLTQSEKALHNEYLKTGKDLNAYTLKLKEQAEERRKATQDERDAEKALKASEKARRDAEREAAKQAKETEKRKKQLEQESSEYYKLNKALGAVRKETKDVLAEMFRMERQGHANTIGYQALKKKSEDLTKQTLYLDKGIKKIDATLGLHQRNVGNYGSAIELLGPQFESINQKLSLFGTSIDELSQKGGFNSLLASVTNLGKGLVAFITTPVGMALTALGSLFALFQANKQTVIDFDAGVKNVAKTTGIAGQELSGFGEAVVELSMKLQVVSTDKLLEYATIAGQLGVKGRSDILAFSESLAMLETASNISGEEGGAQIARMLTLVDGGVHNVKAFGDEIVNLGNNFAATEKEILENATQISQNVGVYKIGRQEVLAFATATKAVGLEAELVGSTFSRTLGEFEKTLRTGKGVADLLKVIGGNQEDLQRKFRQDAAGVFVDYVRGLNNIQQSGGSVNEALERTGIIAVRDQRVISSLATNGFDVLTGALDNVRDANGAMLTEFENGASKLEQQSKRMSIAWDNFVLSIENGEGVIAGVFLRLVDGASILLDTINKAFNPTSLDEFTTRLFDLKAADKIREINLAMREGTGTVGKLSSTDLSKSTQKQINELAKETESSLKSVTNALNLYNEAVKSGELKDGGKNNIADIESTQKALSSKLYQLNLFRKEEKTLNQKIDFEKTEAEKKKAERAQRTFDKQREQSRQAVERQRSLQAQIDALSEQSTRKQLSRDEEELASITDKYKKIREEVDKFYRDPKNKGQRVDTGKLASAERFEINEATTRQGTRELTKQLSEQREIYTAYNSYVEQNGIEAAEKMFGKQAELAREYRSTLEKEYTAITTLQRSASAMAFTGIDVKLTQAQEERAKALREMLDALDKEDQSKARAKYAEALQLAKTFGEQELAIRKKYNDALAQLGKDATDEQRAALKRVLQDDLEALVESSPEFRKVMENIDKSSQVMLGNAFRTGKETVFKLIDGMADATKEQRGELKKLFGKFFDDGAKNADLGNMQAITGMADGFAELIGQSLQFGDNLEKGVDSIDTMLRTVGQLASALGKMTGSAKMEGIGQGFGYFSAAMQVGNMISQMANQRRDSENRAVQEKIELQNDRQLRATEAITKALQMQLEIINEIYGAERLEKYATSLDTIKKNWKDINDQLSGRYMLTANDDFTNSILSRLNNGETQKQIQKSFSVASAEYYKVAKIFDNLWQFDKLEKLPDDITKAREELARLQNQANLGNVDDYTQKLIDQLQAQIDLFDETMNKLREERTGNTFSSLLSDVASLFLNEGENAGQAWADGFDKTLENYMMQKFSRDFLQKKMQGWYDMMDQFAQSGDGIDKAERDQLSSEWEKIREQGQKRLDDMKNILGMAGQDSTSSLKADSGIRGITEQTANRLESEFGGMRLAQLELLQLTKTNGANYLEIANSHLTELIAIQHNTYRTANNTDRLANIETAIVSLNNKVSSSDAARRGAGL